jgi:hypothetical protein
MLSIGISSLSEIDSKNQEATRFAILQAFQSVFNGHVELLLLINFTAEPTSSITLQSLMVTRSSSTIRDMVLVCQPRQAGPLPGRTCTKRGGRLR